MDTDKKKIIIFYASYGGGHLNAAKSLETCLKAEHPNFEVELIDCMKYVNIGIEKITTTAYKEITKKMPWAWGKLYADSQKGILAHLSSRTNKFFAIKLLKLLREKQPDIIISTHFFGSQMCSYLKRKGKINAKLATIMTDFAPHGQWLIGSNNIDYYFVAHQGIKTYLISQNISEEKIFVTGIPISNRFLLDFNKQEILENFNLPKNRKNILFKEVVNLYMSERTLAKGTLIGYNSLLKYSILPKFGNVKVKNITPEMILEFATYMKLRYKAKTAKNGVSLLGSLLKFAFLNGYIKHNPYYGIKNFKA